MSSLLSSSSSFNDSVDSTDTGCTDPHVVTQDGTAIVAETTVTQLAYLEGNNSIKCLVVLCQGLKKPSGEPLINITEEQPWKSVPRNEIKPTAGMLKLEIFRRYDTFHLSEPKPRPSGWTIEKIIQWLDDHPISKKEDIKYLEKVIESHRKASHSAHAAAQLEREALESNWTGKYPYLRLIHCIIDDNIKESYLHRNDFDTTRMQVENRNSVVREKTCWEKISDLWNNPEFLPCTEGGLKELHHDFIDTIEVPHSKVAAMIPATPRTVQDKVTGMVTKLTRVIQNWEKSGQGDGGFHDNGVLDQDDVLFGTFDGREPCALNLRSQFVQDANSYLLYFWHVLEQVSQNVCNRFLHVLSYHSIVFITSTNCSKQA